MTQPLTGPKREKGFGDFRCSEAEGVEAYTFAHKVTEKLESIGLGVNPPRPTLEKEHEVIFAGMKAGQYFDGRLPTVIRKLSLDQISSLFTLYSNWYHYLTLMTRKIATERSEAIRLKEFYWSHLRQAKKAQASKQREKITDQSASDETRGDSRFVEASAKYEVANCTYEILMAMCDAAEQDMKVISREVTIQQNLWEQKKLGNNFGGRFTGGMGQDYGEHRYGHRVSPNPGQRESDPSAVPRETFSDAPEPSPSAKATPSRGRPGFRPAVR